MIKLDHQKTKTLNKICQQHDVQRLQVFGSAARERDFTADSDIDILVEFKPNQAPAMSGLIRLQGELTALFGRDVDLATGSILNNPFRRQTVERDLLQLYAA